MEYVCSDVTQDEGDPAQMAPGSTGVSLDFKCIYCTGLHGVFRYPMSLVFDIQYD